MARTTEGTITAPWFPGIFNPSLSQFEQFQATGPTISNIWQGLGTGLQVPGLDPTQQALIGDVVGTAQNNPAQQQQQQLLQQLAGGPIGSSPTTQAEMQALNQLVLPMVEQQSALRGTAGGGQAIEAIGQTATQALVPFLQDEVARKEAAVQQYGQIGQQHIEQLMTALQAQGLSREVAFEKAQAVYQAQQQQAQLALGLQTMPLQFLGQLGIGRTVSQPSNIWGDVIGALGPALAALLTA